MLGPPPGLHAGHALRVRLPWLEAGEPGCLGLRPHTPLGVLDPSHPSRTAIPLGAQGCSGVSSVRSRLTPRAAPDPGFLGEIPSSLEWRAGSKAALRWTCVGPLLPPGSLQL